MPSFDVTMRSGAAGTVWTDPSSSSPAAPSRINPDPSHPQTRLVATAPCSVTFGVHFGSTDLPADGDPLLDGMTFDWLCAEWSGDAEPSVSSPSGLTAQATFVFSAHNVGHHLLRCQLGLGAGGTVCIPIDIEAP